SAYYQYDVSGIANQIPNLAVWLRPYIKQSLEVAALYRENARAPSTANELIKLITNMKAQAFNLPTLNARLAFYTARAT
ncbi:collagenase, partial [Burkholderia pseudomallei]